METRTWSFAAGRTYSEHGSALEMRQACCAIAASTSLQARPWLGAVDFQVDGFAFGSCNHNSIPIASSPVGAPPKGSERAISPTDINGGRHGTESGRGVVASDMAGPTLQRASFATRPCRPRSLAMSSQRDILLASGSICDLETLG